MRASIFGLALLLMACDRSPTAPTQTVAVAPLAVPFSMILQAAEGWIFPPDRICRLDVYVSDEQGRPVENVPLYWSTTRGYFQVMPRTTGTSHARAELVMPANTTRSTQYATVRASAGTVTRSIDCGVFPPADNPALKGS
jgi:hypothetical protein